MDILYTHTIVFRVLGNRKYGKCCACLETIFLSKVWLFIKNYQNIKNLIIQNMNTGVTWWESPYRDQESQILEFVTSFSYPEKEDKVPWDLKKRPYSRFVWDFVANNWVLEVFNSILPWVDICPLYQILLDTARAAVRENKTKNSCEWKIWKKCEKTDKYGLTIHIRNIGRETDLEYSFPDEQSALHIWFFVEKIYWEVKAMARKTKKKTPEETVSETRDYLNEIV